MPTIMPTPIDMPAIQAVCHLSWGEIEAYFNHQAALRNISGVPLPVQGINPKSSQSEYLAIFDANNPVGPEMFDPLETFLLLCRFVAELNPEWEGLHQIHQQGDMDGDVIVYLQAPWGNPACPLCNSRECSYLELHGEALETAIRRMPGLVRQHRCRDCLTLFLWDHATGKPVKLGDVWK